MRLKYIGLILVTLLILGAIGCAPGVTPAQLTPGNQNASPTGTEIKADIGTIEFLVTDAPAKDNVTAINVTISAIAVHCAGTASENITPSPTPTATDNTTSDNQTPTISPTPTVSSIPTQDGWLKIKLATPQTFELLSLQDVEQFLTADNISAGKYTQIRLTIDKVEVALGDGEPQPAELPSNELKIVRPFEITAGQSTILTLDFLADKMVSVTGNGKINVKPVVKLTVKEAKAHQSVSVQGTIAAVDTEAETVTITPTGETETVVLDIKNKTEISVDGKAATITELAASGAGKAVTATYYADTMEAINITV